MLSTYSAHHDPEMASSASLVPSLLSLRCTGDQEADGGGSEPEACGLHLQGCTCPPAQRDPDPRGRDSMPYCPAYPTALRIPLPCIPYCPAYLTALHTQLPCGPYCHAYPIALRTLLPCVPYCPAYPTALRTSLMLTWKNPC